jgi:uncharacterized protein
MAAHPLYQACIPVLARYLQSLERIVCAAQALPEPAHQQLLSARLAPQMISFHGQVDTAAQFALRTACPLAGRPVPPFSPAQPSLHALRAAVLRTAQMIAAIEPAEFAGVEQRRFTERAGEALMDLPAAEFLHQFALPNFFFHLNMAYAMARLHGAPLGKADYDGFHRYPSQA